MWTMTPQGFFSAVQHDTNANLLVVRTRASEDARHLRAWYANWLTITPQDPEFMPPPVVTVYEFSDYPARVIIPRDAWAQFMLEAVEAIDYGNFKAAVRRDQGKARMDVYHDVWEVLLDLEDLEVDA